MTLIAARLYEILASTYVYGPGPSGPYGPGPLIILKNILSLIILQDYIWKVYCYRSI